MKKVVQTAGRNALGTFAPDFAHYNDDILFGENWNNQDIDLKTRSIITVVALMASGITDSSLKFHLGQFTRNYTQTVKRAADNKRRYAPGWVHSTCLLRGFPKGAAPHLAHDFAEQSVVCYTLCRRCPENTVAAGEGKGI